MLSRRETECPVRKRKIDSNGEGSVMTEQSRNKCDIRLTNPSPIFYVGFGGESAISAYSHERANVQDLSAVAKETPSATARLRAMVSPAKQSQFHELGLRWLDDCVNLVKARLIKRQQIQ